MRTTTIFAETHTSERANHVAYRLVCNRCKLNIYRLVKTIGLYLIWPFQIHPGTDLGRTWELVGKMQDHWTRHWERIKEMSKGADINFYCVSALKKLYSSQFTKLFFGSLRFPSLISSVMISPGLFCSRRLTCRPHFLYINFSSVCATGSISRKALRSKMYLA